ncbi:helix-turn-helix domain-containing protein [Secundilactobacillus muriivasis]
MIRNNLSVLMAEKRIKVVDLSNATGISKNTITSTAKNYGKMIQLETINKICQALDVSPTDFFEYAPFDFDYYSEVGASDDEYYKETGLISHDLDCFLNVSKNNNRVASIKFSGSVTNYGPVGPNTNVLALSASVRPVNQNELDKLTPYLSKLSTGFITDITADFEDVIRDSFVEAELVDVFEDIADTKIVEFSLSE